MSGRTQQQCLEKHQDEATQNETVHGNQLLYFLNSLILNQEGQSNCYQSSASNSYHFCFHPFAHSKHCCNELHLRNAKGRRGEGERGVKASISQNFPQMSQHLLINVALLLNPQLRPWKSITFDPTVGFPLLRSSICSLLKDQIISKSPTECWSQGRAKLRDFLRHCGAENTQPSPSFTPTLGTDECSNIPARLKGMARCNIAL